MPLSAFKPGHESGGAATHAAESPRARKEIEDVLTEADALLKQLRAEHSLHSYTSQSAAVAELVRSTTARYRAAIGLLAAAPDRWPELAQRVWFGLGRVSSATGAFLEADERYTSLSQHGDGANCLRTQVPPGCVRVPHTERPRAASPSFIVVQAGQAARARGAAERVLSGELPPLRGHRKASTAVH